MEIREDKRETYMSQMFHAISELLLYHNKSAGKFKTQEYIRFCFKVDMGELFKGQMNQNFDFFLF